MFGFARQSLRCYRQPLTMVCSRRAYSVDATIAYGWTKLPDLPQKVANTAVAMTTAGLLVFDGKKVLYLFDINEYVLVCFCLKMQFLKKFACNNRKDMF
jgi:hypothetical protein